MEDLNKSSIHIGVSVKTDGVRSAFKNAKSLREAALNVPCVNPLELHIDDKIYGLKLTAVDDKLKSKDPDSVLTIGVVDVNVNALSGSIKEGVVVVNGEIDIPKDIGHTNTLDQIYFHEVNDARAVAAIFVEEQMERAREDMERAREVYNFLKKQREENRY